MLTGASKDKLTMISSTWIELGLSFVSNAKDLQIILKMLRKSKKKRYSRSCSCVKCLRAATGCFDFAKAMKGKEVVQEIDCFDLYLRAAAKADMETWSNAETRNNSVTMTVDKHDELEKWLIEACKLLDAIKPDAKVSETYFDALTEEVLKTGLYRGGPQSPRISL